MLFRSVTDKLIRVLGSLRRRSKWCLSVEMPEKRSLQVQGAFLLITGAGGGVARLPGIGLSVAGDSLTTLKTG